MQLNCPFFRQEAIKKGLNVIKLLQKGNIHHNSIKKVLKRNQISIIFKIIDVGILSVTTSFYVLMYF
jgi:hypothetical protein